MKIFINDASVTCPANSSLKDLLLSQNISAVNIAIAIEDHIIPKAQWDTTVVEDGSHIIIIKAVQGG
ncbi:MAG: sulfur carrier protein ThiS [Odoribacter sp.]